MVGYLFKFTQLIIRICFEFRNKFIHLGFKTILDKSFADVDNDQKLHVGKIDADDAGANDSI